MLRFLANGTPNAMIARRLVVSVGTVKLREPRQVDAVVVRLGGSLPNRLPGQWLYQRSVTGYGSYVDAEFLGGRSSLDYIGTVRWRRGDKPHDYLAGPSDLAEWATMSGLIDEPPRVRPAQLVAARGLREVIYRVIYGRLAGETPSASDVAAINLAAGRGPVEISLDADGCVHRVGTVGQLLGSVARDALDLVGSDEIDLVRECDGPGCTRLYVDSSRARNRRWCSNAVCGNQAKVAAFRERARHSAETA